MAIFQKNLTTIFRKWYTINLEIRWQVKWCKIFSLYHQDVINTDPNNFPKQTIEFTRECPKGNIHPDKTAENSENSFCGCWRISAQPKYHHLVLEFYAGLVLHRVRLTNKLVGTISRLDVLKDCIFFSWLKLTKYLVIIHVQPRAEDCKVSVIVSNVANLLPRKLNYPKTQKVLRSSRT